MKNNILFGSVILLVIVILLSTGNYSCGSCNSSIDSGLKNVITFHYDHVANTNEVRFGKNLNIPNVGSIGSVKPKEGLWAIFVLCSLDVQGKEIQIFKYNTSNFYVEYEGQNYGHTLLPGTIWFGSGYISNDASNTPQVADEIVKQVQLGPNTQDFPPGLYPALNYRIAILIPAALSSYRGEQLTLKYSGQPSILLGGGNSPIQIEILGANFTQPAGICRPPLQ